MPSNFLTADIFENYVKQKFKEFKSKIKITILHKKEIQAKKMGLLLAVGQASARENEPRIVAIEYRNSNDDKISLVGKGILHDTGGLNLKPGNAMKNMHGDMTGAAIVMGTVYALAKANVKTNVVAIAPLTSNEINERAYRVNDIIHSYSGKTIEITNTDAEGRLILADAITYASKDVNASTIVSIATLTGAITIALGSVFAGY
jgi:leucyl aminopeptidase